MNFYPIPYINFLAALNACLQHICYYLRISSLDVSLDTYQYPDELFRYLEALEADVIQDIVMIEALQERTSQQVVTISDLHI